MVPENLPRRVIPAEISGDGVSVTVRVSEYFVDVEGQNVPEMFCLVTDLLDWREYPARDLAALYLPGIRHDGDIGQLGRGLEGLDGRDDRGGLGLVPFRTR